MERRQARQRVRWMAAIAVQKGDVPDDNCKQCGIAIKGPEFLFNKDIDDYCLLVLREAVNLRTQKYLIDLNQDSESEETQQRLTSYGGTRGMVQYPNQ